MTVIVAYVATMFFLAPAPGISEVRDFMQILPLSVILLSDWWMRLLQPSAPANAAPSGSARWVTRGTVSLLPPMIVALILASVSVITWRYYVTAENVNAYNQELVLARAAMKDGDLAGAVDHEEQALALNMNSVEALNNIAWLRATAPDAGIRNGDEAVRLAEQACELTHRQEPVPLSTLAAAYAEVGRYDDAVTTAQAAITIAQEKGETNFVDKMKQCLQLYTAHKPYRQEVKK
jgi:tetratricopeptide (TPR) repeat protein